MYVLCFYLCAADNALLVDYCQNGMYTGYIVEKNTGNLFATSTGETLNGALTKAVGSADALTRASYSYLVDSGFSVSGGYVAPYDAVNNMAIQLSTYTDDSGFLKLDIVFVELQSIASAMSSADDDEYQSQVILGVSIVAAVFGFLFLLLLSYTVVSHCKKGQNGGESDSAALTKNNAL